MPLTKYTVWWSGASTSYRTVAVDEMEYRAVDVALEVQKGDFILLLCLNNSNCL